VDFDEVLYLTDTGRRWDGDLYNIRDKGCKAEGTRAQRHKGSTGKYLENKEDRGQEVGGEDPYKDWKVKPIKYRPDVTKHNISPSRPPLATEAFLTTEGLPKVVAKEAALSPSPCKFHSTSDIINAAENGQLPDKIMMTFHPQRWTDKPLPWVKELVWQNIKNIGKYFLVRKNQK